MSTWHHHPLTSVFHLYGGPCLKRADPEGQMILRCCLSCWPGSFLLHFLIPYTCPRSQPSNPMSCLHAEFVFQDLCWTPWWKLQALESGSRGRLKQEVRPVSVFGGWRNGWVLEGPRLLYSWISMSSKVSCQARHLMMKNKNRLTSVCGAIYHHHFFNSICSLCVSVCHILVILTIFQTPPTAKSITC